MIEKIQAIKENKLLKVTHIKKNEYLKQLIELQDSIAEVILPGEDLNKIQFEDVKCRYTYLARKYHLDETAEVVNVTNGFKYLSKEIAISSSGKIGEEVLEEFIHKSNRRDVKSFRNISLFDKNEKEITEIDNLVLTSDGLILLEAKRIKQPVTLDKDGRLVYSANICYDNIPLAKKMQRRAELLYKELLSLGFDVKIDTCIVVVPPKGEKYPVNNEYGRQQIKNISSVPNMINNFTSYHPLKSDQYDLLNQRLSELETNQKEQEITYDFVGLVNDLTSSLMKINELQSKVVAKEVGPSKMKKHFNLGNILTFNKLDPVGFAAMGVITCLSLLNLYSKNTYTKI